MIKYNYNHSEYKEFLNEKNDVSLAGEILFLLENVIDPLSINKLSCRESEEKLFLASEKLAKSIKRKHQVVNLRKLTDPNNDGVVVYSGTVDNCNRYAENQGYHWKENNNVFGGYFVDKNGDCLIPE
jgi:hypothetical protein